MDESGARCSLSCGIFATTLALCLTFSGSWAQGLEEIIITARKKEESLQDTPLSVSAFTAEGLQQRNIDSAYDLANFTPNFQFNRNIVGRRLDAPNVRGQFSALLGGSPAQGGANAAFFVDGVFVSGTGGSQAIANLERVEILRGPQAAQFGRATFAGAVNFITKAPTNDFAGEIDARIGEDEDYKTSAWIGGPIVKDKLLFLVSGSFATYGGEWRNELLPCPPGPDTGREDCTFITPLAFNWPIDGQPPSANRADYTQLGGEETWDVTGRLTWDVTQNLQVNFKASYSETDDDHYAAFFQDELNCYGPGTLANGNFTPGWYCGELTVDGLRNTLNIADLTDGATSDFGTAAPAPFVGIQTQTERYLVEAIYSLGQWGLLGRYSHNVQEVESYRDLDRGPGIGPLGINVFNAGEINEFEDDSVEIRISSQADAPVRATAGAYYYKADEIAFQRDFTGICRFNFGDPHLRNNGDGTFTELYQGDPGYESTPESPIAEGTIKNTAVFGTIEWDIADNLTFAYETRYAKDELSRKSARGIAASESFYSFTPRYTLTYRPTEDITLSGIVAKGTKPGGLFFAYFDVDVPSTETEAALADGRALFDEEKAWTYELGAKTAWLDNRLIFNTSVFYIDWTNQGINETDFITTQCGGQTLSEPNNILTNAGGSRVIGAEVQLDYQVTDNIYVSAAYGLADTKLEEFNSLDFADLTGISDPDLINGGNVSGHEAPRVPKHSFNLSGTYTRALGSNGADWFARIDYIYEDRQWVTPINAAFIGATNTINFRLGLTNDSWRASIFIDNLTNEDAPTLVSSFPNFTAPLNQLTNSFPLQPRRGKRVGASLNYQFGQ